jgi:hypothetical protein
MKDTKETKVYPSQLATKSLACRIPAQDYVTILNDAISKGININDWLLMKIYNSLNENVNTAQSLINGELKNVEDSFPITLDDFINVKGESIKSMPQYYEVKSITSDDYLRNKKMTIKMLWSYVSECIALREENERLENNFSNKVADINDVRNQITILINNKFSSTKDRKEFRSEILPLLKELE